MADDLPYSTSEMLRIRFCSMLCNLESPGPSQSQLALIFILFVFCEYLKYICQSYVYLLNLKALLKNYYFYLHLKNLLRKLRAIYCKICFDFEKIEII